MWGKKSTGRKHNFRSGISVEEIMLDGDLGQSHEKTFDKSFNLKTTSIYLISFLIILLVFSGRVYNLQIVQGDNYRIAAEDNRTRVIPQFAPRGLIVDRHGEVIARNIPNFDLVVIPKDLTKNYEERNIIFKKITDIIDISVEDLQAKIANTNPDLVEPVLLASSLEQEQALALEELISKNSAFKIQSLPIREYINAPAFAQIVGYVGKLDKEEWQQKKSLNYFYNDVIGKSGLEVVYEEHLRGLYGGQEYEVDAEGNILKNLRTIDSVPGNDLELTIDAALQIKTYESLLAMMKKVNAIGATVIVSNPKTGEILSMVSLPSYDNNLFSKGISSTGYSALLNNKNKPLLNRAISGLYPPGSVIKPVVAAAALEEGVITKNTIINDEGYIKVGEYIFRGWDREGLGPMNVISAIAESSDPFFYIVGGGHESSRVKGLGIEKLADYLKKFGLGQLTKVNLLNEQKGLVPTPAWKKQVYKGTDEERWYLGNTYHLSIGQGDLLATPLQVNNLTSAIANDGIIMKPVLTKLETLEALKEIDISQNNLDIAQEGMRQNVVYGSGVRLSSLSVQVAGKTGTAQFDDKNPLNTHAWYTAYAPFNDPQIVVTVLLESGGEGHRSAVPVASDIIDWWSKNR